MKSMKYMKGRISETRYDQADMPVHWMNEMDALPLLNALNFMLLINFMVN